MSYKSPITTHILDTSRGQAAAGVNVTLYKLNSGQWIIFGEDKTNSDGRCQQLIQASSPFAIGQYKLRFDTENYYKQLNIKSFYPYVEIVFNCTSDAEHYHVPLLLNPFGYTTYRGT